MTSRRKAEQLIIKGLVTVNGIQVTEPGTEVKPETDVILVEGKPLTKQPHIYILLNKPAGYICSVTDRHGRKTVLDLLPDITKRVYPVGRLDYNTKGLLLLTNDGDFANLMTHPRYHISKVYHALVKGYPSYENISALQTGIVIDGQKTAPAKVRILKRIDNTALLEIELGEGRKRQVRHMMSAVGHPVIDLTRVRYSFLDLKGVRVGKYRLLTPDEVERLKSEALTNLNLKE